MLFPEASWRCPSWLSKPSVFRFCHLPYRQAGASSSGFRSWPPLDSLKAFLILPMKWNVHPQGNEDEPPEPSRPGDLIALFCEAQQDVILSNTFPNRWRSRGSACLSLQQETKALWLELRQKEHGGRGEGRRGRGGRGGRGAQGGAGHRGLWGARRGAGDCREPDPVSVDKLSLGVGSQCRHLPALKHSSACGV